MLNRKIIFENQYLNLIVTTITSYHTPQEYLDATLKFLEERELENNLIIGLCNGFEDKSKLLDGCLFINAINDGQIVATSIKTTNRAIVSASKEHRHDIRYLADYYLDNHINIVCVFGEYDNAIQFSKSYGSEDKDARGMIVHQLETLNELSLSPGYMEMADIKDLDLITEWMMIFEEEAGGFSLPNREQMIRSTRARIEAGNFFKWIVDGETVSMAALIRKTKNIGIVGFVYTPKNLRGKGYATVCTWKLSEHILQSGFKYCGLFTDASNPVSNKIYRNIGYLPVTEFIEIKL